MNHDEFFDAKARELHLQKIIRKQREELDIVKSKLHQLLNWFLESRCTQDHSKDLDMLLGSACPLCEMITLKRRFTEQEERESEKI